LRAGGTLQTRRSGFAARTLRTGWALQTLRSGRTGLALRRCDVTPDGDMASRHDMPPRGFVLSPWLGLSETVRELPGRRSPVIVADPDEWLPAIAPVLPAAPVSPVLVLPGVTMPAIVPAVRCIMRSPRLVVPGAVMLPRLPSVPIVPRVTMARAVMAPSNLSAIPGPVLGPGEVISPGFAVDIAIRLVRTKHEARLSSASPKVSSVWPFDTVAARSASGDDVAARNHLGLVRSRSSCRW